MSANTNIYFNYGISIDSTAIFDPNKSRTIASGTKSYTFTIPDGPGANNTFIIKFHAQQAGKVEGSVIFNYKWQGPVPKR